MDTKFGKLAFTFGLLIVLTIVKNLVLQNIIYTLLNAIFGGESTLTYILSELLSAVSVALLALLPLYWQLRENSEERREFLKYFEDKPFNAENDKAFTDGLREARRDKNLFIVAAVSVVFIEYLNKFIDSLNLIYFAFMAISIGVMLTVYLIGFKEVRKKLHVRWDAERLNRYKFDKKE